MYVLFHSLFWLPKKKSILLNNHAGTHAPGRVFTRAERSPHIHSVPAAFHCAVAERNLGTKHTHFNTNQPFTEWPPSDDSIQHLLTFSCLRTHARARAHTHTRTHAHFQPNQNRPLTSPLARVRMIGLWGLVRLHPCCTLSYKCAQVEDALTSHHPHSKRAFNIS